MPVPYGVQVTQRMAAASPQQLRRLSRRLRLLEAVDRIVDEAECTRFEALLTLGCIRAMVWRARRKGYAECRITSLHMKFKPYRIFDKVMPHDQASADGSAHRAIEDAFISLRRNEFAIRHESVRFCVFRLLTNAMC